MATHELESAPRLVLNISESSKNSWNLWGGGKGGTCQQPIDQFLVEPMGRFDHARDKKRPQSQKALHPEARVCGMRVCSL